MTGNSSPPPSELFENWYITTDFFANGGKIWRDWGPFPTQELALRVRELVEAMPINRSLGRTFAVDRLAEKSRSGSRARKVGPAASAQGGCVVTTQVQS